MASSHNVMAIVLCGGLGTRLGALTQETPKPMMPIGERPFLELVLDTLIDNGVEHITLAVSHLKGAIIEHFGNRYRDIPIQYAVEDEPLGTGGAICNTIAQYHDCPSQPLLIVNGDTYCGFDLTSMLSKLADSDLVMLTKEVTDISRYGAVLVDSKSTVTAFCEKDADKHESGLINAGTYLTRVSLFMPYAIERFSFETEVLERFSEHGLRVSAMASPDYFIDIGIPEDYQTACRLLTV